VGSRKPVAPLVVSLTPVDFSTGNATLQLTFNPVTQDINGNPITVEYYNLYYDDNPYLDSPGVAPTNLTSLLLYFGNVGMLEQGFVRVTAVDENGLLVADSHPELPLPDAATLQTAPASFLRPVLPEAVNESTR
jgi:hypothetical protein